MNHPTRKNPRLKHYDYSNPGAYFVTICAHARQSLFGAIVNEHMVLKEFGEIVRDGWLALPTHHPDIALDEFIVMPNHFHGIVFLGQGRARQASPLHQSIVSLGTVMGGFKSAVSRAINFKRGTPGAPALQRNYHEHVIRNEASLIEIREYIANNPLKWALDKYFTPDL